MANYNDRATRILVDPPQLYDVGQEMSKHGTAIADGVDRLLNTWKDLKLGWMGQTAESAKEFADRWDNTAYAFFGKEEDAKTEGEGLGDVKPGVLGKVVKAVQSAANNYGYAEEFAAGLFNKFADNLSSTGEGDSDGDLTRNNDKPPITEHTG